LVLFQAPLFHTNPSALPLSATDGLLAAFDVNCSEAVRLPEIVGVNEIFTTQVPFTLRVPEQVLLSAKAAALGPAIATFVIDNGPDPAFLTVTA
jgi:hypothetical protein